MTVVADFYWCLTRSGALLHRFREFKKVGPKAVPLAQCGKRLDVHRTARELPSLDQRERCRLCLAT